MQRRSALSLLGAVSLTSVALVGCGFKLRGAQSYNFETIAVQPNPGGSLVIELRRSFGGAVKVLPLKEPLKNADVILEILQETREKTVVGVNSSGQVREFQLRIRLRFRVRTPEGEELVPDTEILQKRDLSFNESASLAKEAEEGLLYRDMQSDLVQQLLRRLAAVKYAAQP
ncbi:LPS assembly lipoprotein LptE [Rhodoferax sp. PAMC 29310]|uniref:LPS-assembly lipoprotein LptE n=1 Tax=Rhodoferax sp. PAMC 29310 TaxID=2822760 RepID=UPI001B332D1E|nr:LPS assembly lipoprotein LptE [Rhodoferax sp. PAMC 29310]